MGTNEKAGRPPAAERPRIYVASLADYNAGTLHGRWIDADQDADAIRAEVAAMLAESSEPLAEEWAIHDYDNFAGYRVAEFADFEHVAAVARMISEHGPVFAGLLEHLGGNLDEARAYMEERYRGAYDDLGRYASEVIGDLYHDAVKGLPDVIRNIIDWDAIGRDMEMGGDIFTIRVRRTLHVFDSHL